MSTETPGPRRSRATRVPSPASRTTDHTAATANDGSAGKPTGTDGGDRWCAGDLASGDPFPRTEEQPEDPRRECGPDRHPEHPLPREHVEQPPLAGERRRPGKIGADRAGQQRAERPAEPEGDAYGTAALASPRLRQPRHAIRAWYCPFTLAFRSDPRRVSGRLPRAVAVRAPAECVACSLAALGGATIDTATSALVKESRWL